MADNLLNAILGITPSRASVQPETGMFGVSPYEVEQQRYAQDAAFADKYAQMAPFAKAESQLARAGAGLGRGIGGMMGLVDPRVEQAKQQQSIQSQIDHSTVEGLLKGAQLFNAAGNPRMAFMYTQAAQAQKAKQQAALMEARKQDLAERKQDFSETEAFDLRKKEIEQRYELAKERAADARLAAADRVAAQREATQMRMLIAQMGIAAKQEAKKPLSATAQKEVFEADEAVMGAKAGAAALKSALDINKKAMGFKGAGLVADVGSVLPDALRPKTFDATQELDNIVQQSVLPQLKSIFGANPTEGERKILIEVAGSSSKPAAVREGIFKRAVVAAENRAKFNEEKAKKLREGTYFNGAPLDEPTIPEVVVSGGPPPGAVRRKQ